MTTQQMSDSLAAELTAMGIDITEAARLADAAARARAGEKPELLWQTIVTDVLNPQLPFEAHQRLHAAVFADWDASAGPIPVWIPDPEAVEDTNIAQLMHDEELKDYPALHRWSIEDRTGFWAEMIDRVGIAFDDKPDRIMADEAEVESPHWLPGATLNIADSCFTHDPSAAAIIHGGKDGTLHTMSLDELEATTNRVANGLVGAGLEPGEAVAIDMLMTAEAVAIYLGIVRAGGVVVSIADSFAPEEIATRLRLAGARAIFTQDVIVRDGRTLPLYEKVVAAEAPLVVVLPAAETIEMELREGDLTWTQFLGDEDVFETVRREPADPSNILFSSGTTGDPKAIPWTHTTPIKCAVDGWLHHDIRPGDVVAWPSNLGWMMGPWLIYAALVNHASIALFEGAPNTRGFCEFVQDAKVTMLGVVPSLVKAWRTDDAVAGLDWSSIRCFSSTGECANAEDMFWLMSRAGYRPVVEYCGGTEIGGGYITGTCVQPAAPATFSTPALGLDLVILDDAGQEADTGELYLIPPSIGLSNELLNGDHHEVYFQDTPAGPGAEPLRRHGDEMTRLPGTGSYFRAQGRADDTMNLSGIKISSAEIERVLSELSGIRESAAIAVPPPDGGPDRLVIFVVAESDHVQDVELLQPEMQTAIKEHLNPLFRIHEIRYIEGLPRTASNKVMRRSLRTQIQDVQ